MAKAKLSLLIAVILFAATTAQTQPADSLPEKYVKKVLIEAKWGDGPGEFGITPTLEQFKQMVKQHGSVCGEIYGPDYFDIDESGNIYILDQINKRVQLFDQDGEFIGMLGVESRCHTIIAGKKKSLFTVTPIKEITVGGQNSIVFRFDHFNSDRKMEDQFTVEFDRKGEFATNIWERFITDPQGDIWFINKSVNSLVPITLNGKVINKVVTKEIKDNLKKPLLTISNGENIVNCDTKNIEITNDKKSEIIKKIPFDNNKYNFSEIIGVDEDDNIYVKVGYWYTKPIKMYILKYNKDGRLLAKIEAYDRDSDQMPVATRRWSLVDKNGNIYCLTTMPIKGFIFGKWSKQ